MGLGTASVMAGWALADIGVAQTGVLVATNLLNRATDLVPDAAGKAAYDLAFAIFILPHSLIAMSLAGISQESRVVGGWCRGSVGRRG